MNMFFRHTLLAASFTIVAISSFNSFAQNLGEKDWSGIRSMAGLDGKMYVASDVALWEVDKAGKGRKMSMPKNWGRTYRVAAHEGKIFAINEEQLYAVGKAGGATLVSQPWYSVTAMASLDGTLYLTSQDDLWALGKDGKGISLGSNWYNVKGMAALNGKLYILSRDQINEADKSGARRVIGTPFNAPAGIVAQNGQLYVFAFERTDGSRGSFNEPTLFKVNAETGERTKKALPASWPKGTGAHAIGVVDGTAYFAVPSYASNILYFAVRLD
jgi:hypothetical protein